MIKKGVILKNEQSLKVIKLNDNQIKILPGSAVFSDGGVMRIDDEGVTLPIEGSGVFYVYLQNGFVHGDVCPVISKTEPDDNAILLAKIDNDSIADMRKSAVLKIWEA